VFRQIKYLKKDNISSLFEIDIPNDCEIDILFYQLGLRKNLPVMDWLYFEYIKFLNRKNKIKELVIFPTIIIPQHDNDFKEFFKNVNKLFKGSEIKLTIIDPCQDNYFNGENLISTEFIETLKYIGSKRYFDFLSENFGVKINSISDFNKFSPTEDKIMEIFLHICKSWSTINYLEKNIDFSKSMKISIIFWEWEVEKLGVIKHYLEKKGEKNIKLYTISGKTQMLNKNKPIPDIENKTICIFGDEKSTIMEAATKYKSFLKKYNSILRTVLSMYENVKEKEIRENGKKIWINFKRNNYKSEIKNIKETNDLFIFLELFNKIRNIIENEYI
jgi:hypothetical protein